MFTRHTDHGYEKPLPGIERKTLAWGDTTLLTEFRFEAGAVLPQHDHPHEQSGYLVSGRIRLFIGAEVFEVSPGDGWCIPGNVTHGAEIVADAVAVEVFSPVREDYLPAAT